MTEADRRQVEMIEAYLSELWCPARSAPQPEVTRRVARRAKGPRRFDAMGRPKYWLYGRPRVTYAELRAQVETADGLDLAHR